MHFLTVNADSNDANLLICMDSYSPISVDYNDPFELGTNPVTLVKSYDEAVQFMESSIRHFHQHHWREGISSEEFFKIYEVFAPYIFIYFQENSESLVDKKYAKSLLPSLCSSPSDGKTAQMVITNICKKLKVPLIAGITNPNSKSADDVSEDLYLINPSDVPLNIVKASASFHVTVDEKSGAGVTHGSPPLNIPFVVLPKSYLHVGNILGWELDSSLWFDVWFRKEKNQNSTHFTFNLKDSTLPCILPQMNQRGFLYRPKELSK